MAMATPDLLSWNQPDAAGIRKSKCGWFTITKVRDCYRATDLGRSDPGCASSLHKTLRLAKAWANNWPSRAFPRTFTTFDPPPLAPPLARGTIYLTSEPTAFNGVVKVVRYKVTVERIDEPEAIKARIRKLWHENTHPGERQSLEDAAAAHGLSAEERLAEWTSR